MMDGWRTTTKMSNRDRLFCCFFLTSRSFYSIGSHLFIYLFIYFIDPFVLLIPHKKYKPYHSLTHSLTPYGLLCTVLCFGLFANTNPRFSMVVLLYMMKSKWLWKMYI
jgi:hypothetical protein